ncbi:hypothetical protein ES706_05490 [subsurface metagenome]
MEKPLTVIELGTLKLPKIGPFPKQHLKNVKIKLKDGTIELGIPPKLLLNFDVIGYESEGIQPTVK